MFEQENNFKVKCIENCYGWFDKLWYKKDNIYSFINGVCIREDGSSSMDYTSFNNFLMFNGKWKHCFIDATDIDKSK